MIQTLLRYACVGAVNTAVDLILLNILFFFWEPATSVGLLRCSFISGSCAIVVSYILNRKWTFQYKGEDFFRTAFYFLAVALFALVVNTALFLASYKILIDRLNLAPWVILNGAKAIGIAGGFVVGFVINRFFVFPSEAFLSFRSTFTFSKDRSSAWIGLPVIATFACAIRLIFYFEAPVIYGDATHYIIIGQQLASGDFAAVASFWSSLYCYWIALLALIYPFNPVDLGMLAALIPGVGLIFPLFFLVRDLFNQRVAYGAAVLVALMPRFVEYSVNGYAEMFYIFWMVVMVWMATALIRSSDWGKALLLGAAWGAYFCTRQEGLFFGLGLIILLMWQRKWRAVAQTTAAFILLTGGYMALSEATLGTAGIFQKNSNLHKTYSEQLDPVLAMKEAYGEKEGASSDLSFFHTIYRFPRNFIYLLKKIPAVVASPILLVALLYPLVVPRRQRLGFLGLPLVLLLIFPIVFFPLIQVAPRYFFPCAIPFITFGAAAIESMVCYYGKYRKLLYGSVLVPCLGVIALRVSMLDVQAAPFRELARWVAINVPHTEKLYGDGYGYINRVGFLSGHSIESRQWASSSDGLARVLEEQNGEWLILFEPFLERYNPDLLMVLEEGISGMEKKIEIKDKRGKRYQVYERKHTAN